MQRYLNSKITVLFSLFCLITACSSTPPHFLTTQTYGDYQKVYVAPVVISDELQKRATSRMRRSFNQKRPVTSKDLDSKASDLTARIRHEISKSHDLYENAAPDTLTVRITLTDLIASRPTKADYENEPGLSFRSIYAGGLSAEVCFETTPKAAECFTYKYNGNLQEVRGGSIWYDADYGIRQLSQKIAGTIRRL